MSLSYDVIKIKLIEQGYLSGDYPYHLISDSEMCDAFLNPAEETLSGAFVDWYSDVLANDSIHSEAYIYLIHAMRQHISLLKQLEADPYSVPSLDGVPITEAAQSRYNIFFENGQYVLPNWIQSYMLQSVVGPTSDTLDIHDLLVLLGKDNIDDDFTPQAAEACLQVSTDWIARLDTYRFPDGTLQRPPTLFGEPHVIKSLRLAQRLR